VAKGLCASTKAVAFDKWVCEQTVVISDTWAKRDWKVTLVSQEAKAASAAQGILQVHGEKKTHRQMLLVEVHFRHQGVTWLLKAKLERLRAPSEVWLVGGGQQAEPGCEDWIAWSILAPTVVETIWPVRYLSRHEKSLTETQAGGFAYHILSASWKPRNESSQIASCGVEGHPLHAKLERSITCDSKKRLTCACLLHSRRGSVGELDITLSPPLFFA
jgi:hypothetical protein